MRQALLLSTTLALAGLAAGPTSAQDRGLTAPADALGQVMASTRWQTRLERELGWSALRSTLPASVGPQTLRLMGDYQLDALRLGQTGGLRLTGGLLINLRNSTLPALPAETPPTLPYAGIGYASGSLSGSWGISADLGLAAGGLGVSLGNRNGPLGLAMDGGLRDLKLQPMIRLGMNLAF